MSREGGEVEWLRRLFRHFGATQCRGRSPVYEVLSEAVASDDDLLDLLMDTPGDQRRPSLLFAGVNLLLASRPGAELAEYYAVHGGRRETDDGLVPAFRAFCATHRDALLRVLRAGSTQTNEIRRCVALRLGLDRVLRRWPGPFALVEVGASAGLNLLFDRYDYCVGGRHRPAAGDASPVVVSCGLRGAPGGFALGPAPVITHRLGIDRRPVDLSDAGARAWLEAFVWPEQSAELATLRGAVDMALAGSEARVVAGEATTDTARMIAEIPGREPVVVFTASLLSYLTAEARDAFAARLQEAAGRRPVAWVFAESPGLLAATGLAVAALDGPLSRRNSLYAVGTSLRHQDHHDDRLLALADPYLRWIAPARGEADDFAWLP